MDWEAQHLSSIEAAVKTAVEAALQRSMCASVEESADETASRRTSWFGEAGRRRIELAEDRVRRDPVWAEKIARRHASFLATTTSDASVKPKAISNGVAHAATTPTTCSTQYPSRDVTVSLPALATATTSVVGVVPERCCFDPEPVVATSALEPSSARSTTTASIKSETAMSIQTAQAVDSASICNDSGLALAAPITCSTECPGGDNSAARATTAPSPFTTRIVPSAVVMREENTVSASSAGSMLQRCYTELCDEQPGAPTAVSSSGCDGPISLTYSEALAAMSWCSYLFLEEDYATTGDKFNSVSCVAMLGTGIVAQVTFKVYSSVSPEHLSCLVLRFITWYAQYKWLPMSLPGHCLVSSLSHCFTQNCTAFVYLPLMHCAERNPWPPPPSNRSTACRIFNLHVTLYSLQISGDLDVLKKVKLTWGAAHSVIIFVPGVQIAKLKPTVFKWPDPFCFDIQLLLASTLDLLLARIVWNWCCLDNLHGNFGMFRILLSTSLPPIFEEVCMSLAEKIQHLVMLDNIMHALSVELDLLVLPIMRNGALLWAVFQSATRNTILLQPWDPGVLSYDMRTNFQVELLPKWLESFVELQHWSSEKIFLLVPKVLRIVSDNGHGIMMLGKVIREKAFILQLFGRLQTMQVCWLIPYHVNCIGSTLAASIPCLNHSHEIVWPLDLIFSSTGNKSREVFHLIKVRYEGYLEKRNAALPPFSTRTVQVCLLTVWKLSWDPGIWALLCFFGFFTQDEAAGRRSAVALTYCHCIDHAYYFVKVCADQGYYLDVFRDHVHIVHDHYIGVFLRQVRAVSYLNLVKVCLDYCIHRDLEEVMKHQVPWDPGGSTRLRLGVKPKIKGGGMLATLLPGIWAATVGPQPAWKPHEEGTDIYERNAYRRSWLGTDGFGLLCFCLPSSSSRVSLLLSNG